MGELQLRSHFKNGEEISRRIYLIDETKILGVYEGEFFDGIHIFHAIRLSPESLNLKLF